MLGTREPDLGQTETQSDPLQTLFHRRALRIDTLLEALRPTAIPVAYGEKNSDEKKQDDASENRRDLLLAHRGLRSPSRQDLARAAGSRFRTVL